MLDEKVLVLGLEVFQVVDPEEALFEFLFVDGEPVLFFFELEEELVGQGVLLVSQNELELLLVAVLHVDELPPEGEEFLVLLGQVLQQLGFLLLLGLVEFEELLPFRLQLVGELLVLLLGAFELVLVLLLELFYGLLVVELGLF